jgi:small subunit ribosomal protein S13
MAEQIQIDTPEKSKVLDETRIVRILSTDIEGKTKIYPGLTKIKGVSFTLSNALCRILNIDKRKKIGSLRENEIETITNFLKNPKVPIFIMNRRKDFTTGENKHLVTTNLELQKEFDIKRHKKIRSYKGLRHATKQPVRGQRTRSHFRAKKRQAVGVKKKK